MAQTTDRKFEPTPLLKAEIEELFEDVSFLLRITNREKYPFAWNRRRRLRTRLGQLAFG
jgi:hypothetical protein